jgi:hypothetical protein
MPSLLSALLWIQLVAARVALDSLHARGGPDDPNPGYGGVNCKENSMSAPAWYLYDPQFRLYNSSTGGTFGDAGFSAYNLVTDKSFICYTKNINLSLAGEASPWYSCGDNTTNTTAEYRFDLTDSILSLKESWVCGNDSAQVSSNQMNIQSPPANIVPGLNSMPAELSTYQSSLAVRNTRMIGTRQPGSVSMATPRFKQHSHLLLKSNLYRHGLRLYHTTIQSIAASDLTIQHGRSMDSSMTRELRILSSCST